MNVGHLADVEMFSSEYRKQNHDDDDDDDLLNTFQSQRHITVNEQ